MHRLQCYHHHAWVEDEKCLSGFLLLLIPFLSRTLLFDKSGLEGGPYPSSPPNSRCFLLSNRPKMYRDWKFRDLEISNLRIFWDFQNVLSRTLLFDKSGLSRRRSLSLLPMLFTKWSTKYLLLLKNTFHRFIKHICLLT